MAKSRKPIKKRSQAASAKPKKKTVQTASSDDRPRLQKVLASAGFGSRRVCEELIVEGRVEIDRQVANELGTRVDPLTQEVRVDGEVVRISRPRYFMLNKPVDVVSTNRDPWARLRVIDLIDSEDRLFTVGRLDKSSSGLILVTNDGELANRLAHPRYEVTKTYHAIVRGKPSADVLKKMRAGVHLAEGIAKVENVKLKTANERKSTLEIVLAEGKNREIRRMLARFDHKVLQLKRVALGPVKLGELPVGAHRELTREEIASLQKSSRGIPTKPTKKRKRRSAVARPEARSSNPRKVRKASPQRKERSRRSVEPKSFDAEKDLIQRHPSPGRPHPSPKPQSPADNDALASDDQTTQQSGRKGKFGKKKAVRKDGGFAGGTKKKKFRVKAKASGQPKKKRTKRKR